MGQLLNAIKILESDIQGLEAHVLELEKLNQDVVSGLKNNLIRMRFNLEKAKNLAEYEMSTPLSEDIYKPILIGGLVSAGLANCLSRVKPNPVGCLSDLQKIKFSQVKRVPGFGVAREVELLEIMKKYKLNFNIL